MKSTSGESGMNGEMTFLILGSNFYCKNLEYLHGKQPKNSTGPAFTNSKIAIKLLNLVKGNLNFLEFKIDV